MFGEFSFGLFDDIAQPVRLCLAHRSFVQE